METRIENGKLICTNVITKEELQRIQDKMLSDHFPWYYTEHVVEDAQKMTEDKDQLQFVHNFTEFQMYQQNGVIGNCYIRSSTC